MRTLWTFQLDNQVHTVTLEHGWLDGRRLILLDSVEIERTPRRLFIDWGSRHQFMIDAHTCGVIIHCGLGSIHYDLEIDGVSVADARYRVRNDILLRPANAPHSGQNTLLRPAETNTENTGAEQLLRAGSEPPTPATK